MINVDRNTVQVPASIRSGFFKSYTAQANEYYHLPAERRRQRRHEFLPTSKFKPDIRETLNRLFRNKCAFCETFLISGDGTIEHFRPRSQAKGFGDISHDHYWWLAYEWSNLYLACSRCAARKEAQFPVSGRRADFGSPDPDDHEERLLLDPCKDEVEQELRVRSDGTLMGLTRRAESTIDVLGLNRPDLCHARAGAMAMVHERLDRTAENSWHRIIADETRPEMEYVAARRTAVEFKVGWGQAKRSRTSSTHAVSPPSPAVQVTGMPATQLRAQYVTHIELRNFKAVRHLDLSLPEPQSDLAGWKVLLGENGTGKSTVLQAIAIALAGPQRVEQLRLRGSDLLSNPRGRGRPPARGSISIQLFGESDRVEVAFSKDGIEFGGGADKVHTLVRAYGATRLFERHSPRVGPGGQEAIRVANLFDPRAEVCNAELWLLAAPRELFDAAALALKDLLCLDANSILKRTPARNPTELRFVENGRRMRLDQLSDGYRSVIALAVDLIAANPEQVSDFTAATGIVLVDELGTHLHPRWRMVIVEALRRTFPRMQFICTTHEPLCLRGVHAPEVGIVSRKENGVAVESTEISPSLLRVDQLLTSPLFGLSTTIDPIIERKFQQYYALLTQDARTKEEDEKRIELRGELASQGMLGYTRRDHLIYDTIDEYLARETSLPPDERKTLRAQTKVKVRDIWRGIERFRGQA